MKKRKRVPKIAFIARQAAAKRQRNATSMADYTLARHLEGIANRIQGNSNRRNRN